jgi:hypothetical protein
MICTTRVSRDQRHAGADRAGDAMDTRGVEGLGHRPPERDARTTADAPSHAYARQCRERGKQPLAPRLIEGGSVASDRARRVIGVVLGIQPQHRDLRRACRVAEEASVHIGHAPLPPPAPDAIDHHSHRLWMPAGISDGSHAAPRGPADQMRRAQEGSTVGRAMQLSGRL